MDQNHPFRVDPADIDFLYGEWRSLVARQSDGPVDAIFDSLCQLYSAAGRVYHNLSHVNFLLSSAQSIRKQLVDYDCVRLAIWFHDAVYDTRSSDNEERSAELAEVSLQRFGFSRGMIDSVRDMILATKQHAPDDGPPDLGAFLDLDLSILGAPEACYGRYSAAIREEYAWVPDAQYRRGRTAILERFLGMERIYRTEYANSRFESQARINIKNEVAQLISGPQVRDPQTG